MAKEGTACDEIFIRLAELYLNRKIIVHSLPSSNEDSAQNDGDTEFSAFEPLHVLITSTNDSKKYYQSIRPKSSSSIKWKRTLASRSNEDQNIIHESNSSESGPIKRTRYNSCSQQSPEVIFCNWKHGDVEESCNR